jgi:hypothetical protein
MRCGAIRLAAALPVVAIRTAAFCAMQARPTNELVKDFLKSETFSVVGATNRRDKFGNKVGSTAIELVKRRASHLYS